MDNFSVSAIIASNNIDYINQSLTSLFTQKETFEQILLVPWGKDNETIREKYCNDNRIIIVEAINDTSLETNRNISIDYLINKQYNPDYIAFLDDDTLLNSSWLENMKKAALSENKNIAFSSITHPVKISPSICKNESIIQSCGHKFCNSSPRDVLYNKNISEIPDHNFEIGFPCGNSSFVPFNAIKKIRQIDSVWDSDFHQWQTCFSFGIKMSLLGYQSYCNVNATAFHEGKVYKTNNNLCEKDILGQLRSRCLLYLKYYPEDSYIKAIQYLENKIIKWKKNGYPGSQISGNIINSIYEKAINSAKEFNFNTYWKDEIKKLSQEQTEKLLFNTHV